MGLRKSKNDIDDISDVMEQIDKENEMKEKTSELDLRLQKMESTIAKLALIEQQVSDTHRETNEILGRVTNTISDVQKAIDIFKELIDYMKDKVVVRAKINTEDIKKVSGVCKNLVLEEQILLEKYSKQRISHIKNQEEEILNLLEKKEGIWLSSFWMKVVIMYLLTNMSIFVLCIWLK